MGNNIEKLNSKEISSTFMVVVKGVIISMIITLLGIFVFACLLTYTNMSDTIINTAIIVITAVSILISTIIQTAKIKKKRNIVWCCNRRNIYVVNLYNF